MSLLNKNLSILLIGDGHLSSFLKPLLNEKGLPFQASSRKSDYNYLELDRYEKSTIRIDNFSTVIWMIPPHPNTLMALKKLNMSQQKLIFISSTSVYPKNPKNNGAFQESSPIAPTTRNGKLLSQAEEWIQKNLTNWAILRPGGLIDQNRHPFKWFSPQSKISDGDSLINFIHTEDLARLILLLAIEQSLQTNHILNVNTGEQLSKRDFYQSLYQKSPNTCPAIEQASASRVISSEKLKQIKEFKLKFPEILKFLQNCQS